MCLLQLGVSLFYLPYFMYIGAGMFKVTANDKVECFLRHSVVVLYIPLIDLRYIGLV